MVNQEFDQKVRRIMILQKQQELYYAQGKWDECRQVLQQIKDLTEEFLDLDEMDPLDRTIVYMMNINTVSKAYIDLQDYNEAGDTIFNSLLEAEPLVENKHEPKAASLLCDQFMTAFINLRQAFPSPPADEADQDSFFTLLEILANLLVQSYDNLCRVTPDNPLTAALKQFTDSLKSQGLGGASEYPLDELVELTYTMIMYWTSLR